MTHRKTVPSPLGKVTLASDGGALTGLWLEGQAHFPQELPALSAAADDPALDMAEQWLRRYFAGERPDPRALPLAPQGTPFRLMIWELLLQIPYGTVVTYGALAAQAAERLGKRAMSAQAVGGAVSRNPISILIPCHRVIGADGSLTGYAGGTARKEALLRLEGLAFSAQNRVIPPEIR